MIKNHVFLTVEKHKNPSHDRKDVKELRTALKICKRYETDLSSNTFPKVDFM